MNTHPTFFFNRDPLDLCGPHQLAAKFKNQPLVLIFTTRRIEYFKMVTHLYLRPLDSVQFFDIRFNQSHCKKFFVFVYVVSSLKPNNCVFVGSTPAFISSFIMFSMT